MKRIIILIIALFACITAAHAVIAYPKPINVTQPDGTVLTIRLHGDEFLHWTTCGNSLVAKGSDGYWHYATFGEDGAMNAAGARVSANKSGDGSEVRPPAAAIAKAMQKRESMTSSRVSSDYPLSTGNPHFLILLIQFSDKKFAETSNFADLLRGENYTFNGATGSVNKYYNDVSFGKFDPQFDIYGPITVPYTSAQCAASDVEAVIDACEAIDSVVDFKKYCNADPNLVDNVFFFFPGYNQAEGGGTDCIWPHAVTYSSPFLTLDGVGIYHYGCASEFKGRSGETMAGIGTFCHEFGHVIGLPDFYDVDYEDNGEGMALQTLSLMSSGNYNNGGKTPPYLTYEEKRILGWDNGLTLLTEGENTLEKTSKNKAYYSPTPTEGEYYLYESRPCEGWDTYTYAPGMAIYHIDKSGYVMPNGYSAKELWEDGYMINAFASHQCMDLVETVPESEYTNLLTFPGYYNVTEFTSESTPSSRAWSGEPTGFNLTNISFNSSTGSTTFTVEKDPDKIVGTVRNTALQAIPNVDIVVKFISSTSQAARIVSQVGNGLSVIRPVSLASSSEYKTKTDANGRYEVVLPQGGVYSISASKEGFMSYFSEITVESTTGCNIILSTPIEDGSTTLQKYKEISLYSLGNTNATDFYAGLNFTADELVEYVGESITSITFLADNGGNGTVDKVGVKVYFDDVLQCDQECTKPVFGTLCTVDISSSCLKIPSDKSVTFVYYLINSSYKYPLRLADDDAPVTGANLFNFEDDLYWGKIQYGNFVISATITDDSTVVDLAGINYIPHKQSYAAGETFNLVLKESSVNPPSSVTWTVNGEPASGSVVLAKGTCTVKAFLTFESGRQETIETKLKVE